MSEPIKNPVTEEDSQTSLFEHETEDQLRTAVEEQFSKIRRQSMLLGAQTVCSVVLEKIVRTENLPGKRTMNDYKRLIKDLKNFCETGLSRKVNTDGETESVDNNTKLMEDSDEGNINQSNTESSFSN